MEIYAKWLDGVADNIRNGRDAWIPYTANADLCVFKEEMKKRNITLIPRREAADRPRIGLVPIVMEGSQWERT